MTRQPKYGELQSHENKEAWRIWTTRMAEPEPCEPLGALLWEPAEQADPILVRKLAKTMERIGDRYADVLVRRHYLGQTLEEVGADLGLTRGGVWQLEIVAIRRVRNRMLQAMKELSE